MGDSFKAIQNLLSCPDDGASLLYLSAEFRCSHCDRRFPICEDNLAEILPSYPCELPASANSEYTQGYLREFKESYRSSETSSAWGAEESVTQSWVRKRHRQVAMVKPLISEGSNSGEAVLCDISAGAGYYTFAYAHLFRFVLHCDLSVDNLTYAWRKARNLGTRNIFFLRADYFAPPFQQSLDRIVCFDTLIRGEVHDQILLSSIVRSLRPGGLAVLDFHNWWHNPLRRLGLLPENFHGNRSYVRSEAEKLLMDSDIKVFKYRPFFQEFDSVATADSLLFRLFPATRLIYSVTAPLLGPQPHRMTCSQPFERDSDATRL
jgi:SAM-dependent methyltransferase